MAIIRSICGLALSSIRTSYSSRLAAAVGQSGGADLFRRQELAIFRQKFHKVSGQGDGFPARTVPLDCRSPFAMSIESKRLFSEDFSHMPEIKDPVILDAFKELAAVNWDEIPNDSLQDVKLALSKSTDDTSGKEALANVFRAAEAVEEFTGVLTSLKMEVDDSIGMNGECERLISQKINKIIR